MAAGYLTAVHLRMFQETFGNQSINPLHYAVPNLENNPLLDVSDDQWMSGTTGFQDVHKLLVAALIADLQGASAVAMWNVEKMDTDNLNPIAEIISSRITKLANASGAPRRRQLEHPFTVQVLRSQFDVKSTRALQTHLWNWFQKGLAETIAFWQVSNLPIDGLDVDQHTITPQKRLFEWLSLPLPELQSNNNNNNNPPPPSPVVPQPAPVGQHSAAIPIPIGGGQQVMGQSPSQIQWKLPNSHEDTREPHWGSQSYKTESTGIASSCPNGKGTWGNLGRKEVPKAKLQVSPRSSSSNKTPLGTEKMESADWKEEEFIFYSDDNTDE